MNVRHETRQNLVHLYDFGAFGVCTPSRCTQIPAQMAVGCVRLVSKAHQAFKMADLLNQCTISMLLTASVLNLLRFC